MSTSLWVVPTQHIDIIICSLQENNSRTRQLIYLSQESFKVLWKMQTKCSRYAKVPEHPDCFHVCNLDVSFSLSLIPLQQFKQFLRQTTLMCKFSWQPFPKRPFYNGRQLHFQATQSHTHTLSLSVSLATSLFPLLSVLL